MFMVRAVLKGIYLKESYSKSEQLSDIQMTHLN